MDTQSSTDRIERSIHIKAPRSKVWHSLSNAGEYGKWFGTSLTGGQFEPGTHVKAPMTLKGCEHLMFDVMIERVEPESLMSYRWHPLTKGTPVDPKEDRTLVTFTLKEADGGTLLTVTETGFDKVAPERRMEAFRGNTNGWAFQLDNIERHASNLVTN